MLHLQRMQKIRLSGRPRFQRFVGTFVLKPNYALPPKVQIEFENIEHLPDESVIFAMNHTDRYNYWPFQYHLWRTLGRFTATWVKGKYYENPWVGKFMELANNIPTVSRGYIVTRDFISTTGRRPNNDEYAALRQWVDSAARGEVKGRPAAVEAAVPRVILEQPRDMLGRRFEPETEDYATCVANLFNAMIGSFVTLNGMGFALGLNLIVFPQGTRSMRLTRGHQGLAQIALHFKKTIVPIGCNGCEKLYPGNSPWARGGRVVYRFGEPITYDSMARFHPDAAFEPLTPAAEIRFGDKFQGFVDEVMQRINPLLDPEYQFGTAAGESGGHGSRRFV